MASIPPLMMIVGFHWALDIGCGIGANSVRLAKRGYKLSACDYSEPILEHARSNIESRGLSEQVDISRPDITDLQLPDATFDVAVCWGVLMHIPDLHQAPLDSWNLFYHKRIGWTALAKHAILVFRGS